MTHSIGDMRTLIVVQFNTERTRMICNCGPFGTWVCYSGIWSKELNGWSGIYQMLAFAKWKKAREWLESSEKSEHEIREK